MLALAEYAVTEQLHDDGQLVLSRGRSADAQSVLTIAPSKGPLAGSSVERLEREFALRDELDPSWAVRPLSLLRRDGDTVLVLEDTGGVPLDRALARPFSIAEFLRAAVGITASLGHVHERGLVHRDVKPANVLIHPDTGEARLMGFGVASHLLRERQPSLAPEAMAGTLAYMAPEQTGRVNRSVDSRSDLYSLGVTLYELLTGKLPFSATEPLDLIHCHVARAPTPPGEQREDVPPVLSAIVVKLLSKAAEDRYQTARGLEADLRRCLDEWEARGRIDPFPLGEHDTPPELVIPERLYGRERESQALLDAFNRVVQSGEPELLLVSGHAGVGKSALITELSRMLVLPSGLFAAGKFDQYKRDIPYAIPAQAFEVLIRQILAKPEDELEHYRATLKEALGPNGRLIVELLPDLSFLIGDQPPVPDVSAQAAQNRFITVFQQFVGVFARREHPLTLFLDDLQRLDAASWPLLEHLLSSRALRYLFVIGAYRSNEVGPEHPLSLALRSLRERGVGVQEIALGPLGVGDIGRLVSDALHCSVEQAAPLAELVYEKTAGNPLFAIQFLTTLWEQRLVEFDPASGVFRWDLAGIRAKGFTDNVLDLMVAKLRRLPETTRMATRSLACLGNGAEVSALARILGKSEEETHVDLGEAVRSGLLIRSGERYSFVHDRIHEATYSLVLPELRAPEHLRIGRQLLASEEREGLEQDVFELAAHFNRAFSLITDPKEKDLLRRLNCRAGRKAKAAIAYVQARAYLARALSLLPPDSWRDRYEETFWLTLELSECEYLVGNFARADELSGSILEQARSHHDRARVYHLRARLYQVTGRFEDALAVGLEALSQFGVTFPDTDEGVAAAVRVELTEYRYLMHGRRVPELLDMPVATDPDARAIIALIAEVLGTAYNVKSKLFSLLILRGVNFSLRYGNTEESAVAYGFNALVRLGLFEDIPSAFEFSELSLRLNRRFDDPRLKGVLLHVHSAAVNYKRRHFATTRPLVEEGFVASQQVGDLVYAAYISIIAVWHCFEAEEPLSEVSRVAGKYLAFLEQTHNDVIWHVVRQDQQLVACLEGATRGPTSFDDGGFGEAECLELFQSRGYGLGVTLHHIRKLIAAFLHERYDEALAHAERAESTLSDVRFTASETTHAFYYALTVAALYPDAPPARQAEFDQVLKAKLAQLELWASNCPANFSNRHSLVCAERARLEGRDLDAMKLYEQAIASARENGFVQKQSLAHELAARFYARSGFAAIAKTYLANAREGYLRWGALYKVREIDRRHPEVAQAPPPGGRAAPVTPLEQLALSNVIKASQALSDEIHLDKLVEKLLTIVVDQAGADRGLLLLRRGDNFEVGAEATTGKLGIEVSVRYGTPQSDDLPGSVFRYVVRTKESVKLDDASAGGPFAEDRYVRKQKPKAMLCLPLVRQGELLGILYLENRLTAGVFAADRSATLNVLSSQAAISLQNARLYSALADEGDRLRASEERFARVFRNNPTPMALIRAADGVLVDANDSFLGLLGLTMQEVMGRATAELGSAYVELFDKLRGDGEGASAHAARLDEFEIDGTLGEPKVLLVASEIIDLAGERCFLATFTDVTERKRAEERLRQVQKLEAIGSLAGGIAHDFNNLLTVINGYSELALMGTDAADPNHELLRAILDAGMRAAGLTKKLLTFSRKGVSVGKVWSLRDIVADLQGTLRRLIEENIELVVELSPDAGLINADRGEIEQALLNLVVNARDAMPNGGRLTIEVKDATLETSTSGALFDVRPGPYVGLAVSDTGAGLSEELKEKIFEPFFTTKGVGKGTGLGLSSVYGLAKQVGGNVTVESELGQGTTICVYFPRVPADAAEGTAALPPGGEGTHPVPSSETVLLVEDEDEVRKFATQALEARGYRVVSARHGREALDLLHDPRQPVDIVVSDLIMPEMGGRELLQRIPPARRPLPVLFISGYSKDIECFSLAEAPLLPKPFGASELAQRVRELLDKAVRAKPQ